MDRPEIRKINSTDFVKHFGAEMKFVTRDKGHLWLYFRDQPRAVVIPMRDEELLHEIQGRKFEDILHRANTRRARMLRAAFRVGKYRSELVEDSDVDVPPFGMTDAEWAENKRYWFERHGATG